jgi:predicted site-specific integrase-resolvase
MAETLTETYNLKELADLAGLTYGTIRVYRSPRFKGALPEPDFTENRRPYWKKETAERWLVERKQPKTCAYCRCPCHKEG